MIKLEKKNLQFYHKVLGFISHIIMDIIEMVGIWGEDHFPNWHTKPAQTLKRGILREWSNTPLIVRGQFSNRPFALDFAPKRCYTNKVPKQANASNTRFHRKRNYLSRSHWSIFNCSNRLYFFPSFS